MLIGIDSSPCSLSLRNRITLCSTTKCHQNKSDLKNVLVQKSFFFSIVSILSIPVMLIGINGGYFPAICRVCFQFMAGHKRLSRLFSGNLPAMFFLTLSHSLSSHYWHINEDKFYTNDVERKCNRLYSVFLVNRL